MRSSREFTRHQSHSLTPYIFPPGLPLDCRPRLARFMTFGALVGLAVSAVLPSAPGIQMTSLLPSRHFQRTPWSALASPATSETPSSPEIDTLGHLGSCCDLPRLAFPRPRPGGGAPMLVRLLLAPEPPPPSPNKLIGRRCRRPLARSFKVPSALAFSRVIEPESTGFIQKLGPGLRRSCDPHLPPL